MDLDKLATDASQPGLNAATADEPQDDHSHDVEQARFHMDQMSDANQATDIEDRLTGQDGVIGVTVNTIDQSVNIAYDPAEVSRDLLRDKIEGSGLDTNER